MSDRLRARLGVVEERDEGGAEARNAYSTAGAWVNCPSCVALVFGLLVGLWLVFLPKWPVHVLAVPGGAMLAGRWWVSQRARARWWE